MHGIENTQNVSLIKMNEENAQNVSLIKMNEENTQNECTVSKIRKMFV